MKTNTRKIVFAALFAAIICVITAFVKVPMPLYGYVNLGDAMVICAGALLGPVGAISALIGSALADLFASYVQYAIPTAIIKCVMALLVWLFVRSNKNINMILYTISGVLAEIVMVLGYFLFEAFYYDKVVALANIPYNLLQGGLSLVGAVVIMIVLKRSKITEMFKS